MRPYTPVSSDDEVGYFDLVIKVSNGLGMGGKFRLVVISGRSVSENFVTKLNLHLICMVSITYSIFSHILNF